MTPKRSISVVLPVYNEEKNLEHAITLTVAALDSFASDYEIIVVDDASTDMSVEIISGVMTSNNRIRLIRHAENLKLGRSLKTGFESARMDLVLYMDADLPVDPNVLGDAIRAMEVTRADVIAGYRFDRTTEGFKRSIYSWGYNQLISVLFGWPYRDINFAFKLMRREVLDAVELKSDGSLIDAELIVKAKNLGFAVQQLGIDYYPRIRGRSTLSSPAVIFKILRELVSLYSDMRHPRRKLARSRAVTGLEKRGPAGT
ncbi:MAG TPA: glycosyltransferase family 2 protein [Thermoanaerobaculia bacterium]|nr:glycosyltransferase family 2 protein [Thermoanaerobaculia bacterium]